MTLLTPVNTVIAPSTLLPSFGYDSRHLCQIPLTLNFGINSTFKSQIDCYRQRHRMQSLTAWRTWLKKDKKKWKSKAFSTFKSQIDCYGQSHGMQSLTAWSTWLKRDKKGNSKAFIVRALPRNQHKVGQVEHWKVHAHVKNRSRIK